MNIIGSRLAQTASDYPDIDEGSVLQIEKTNVVHDGLLHMLGSFLGSFVSFIAFAGYAVACIARAQPRATTTY